MHTPRPMQCSEASEAWPEMHGCFNYNTTHSSQRTTFSIGNKVRNFWTDGADSKSPLRRFHEGKTEMSYGDEL
jgi:hypothetical protein